MYIQSVSNTLKFSEFMQSTSISLNGSSYYLKVNKNDQERRKKLERQENYAFVQHFKSSWSQTVLANQNCANFDLS